MDIVFNRKSKSISLIFGFLFSFTLIIIGILHLFLSNYVVAPFNFVPGLLFLYISYYRCFSPYIKITNEMVIIYRYPFLKKHIKTGDIDTYHHLSESESVIIKKGGERTSLDLRLIGEDNRKELERVFQDLKKQ